ncbi:MAG: endonuclease/exonuclease/phosphatase family protein [Deltaproteobacteria bacterium]|nr:endonuclease/exonuclease/phosphatase family protein [Deltaproteobacteria bacterium]
MRLRLATANIWGLPAPLSWPPRRVRFPRVRRFIEGELDVVLLQEHWRLPARPRVLDNLCLIAPARHEGDSGLALRTHHRVIERRHGSFQAGAASVLDKMWSRKGWQRVALDVSGTRIDVINTHLEAYTPARHALVRARQIDELLVIAAATSGPVVLAGDFNFYAGIAADRQSQGRIEAAGFVDVVASFDTTPTYDRRGERERFDRVFVRGLDCTAARVDVNAGLADHRPVIVELQPLPR